MELPALNPFDDRFLETCAQAVEILNRALIGEGQQSVMGSDRMKVHAAIGDVADQIRDYVREMKKAACIVRIEVKP